MADRPSGAGQDDWHRPLRHVRAAELSRDTAQTSGMTRSEAVSARTVGSERVWMGQTLVGPRTTSGDHHHGDTETAIYVVSGHPVFVFAEDGREVRLTPEPGDYVFVPPFAPHREENPTDEEAVVVLARSSQEAVVVNLPSLLATEPN
ncbi:MAG: Cupin 2 conserved barrel domain protein [Frankiales bacterium]|nr:Cupin 2 conserved barrel domain protein [Frankiales bacterium]